MKRKSLDQIGLCYRTDKSSRYHNYLTTYEEYFAPIRDERNIVLEIGLGDINSLSIEGESALVWLEYFPQSKIYGIDCDEKKFLERDRLKTFKGLQEDSSFLQHVIWEIGHPNIIIDDATHHNDFNILTFETLFPLLSSGGVYIIEDIQTNYWTSWNGNPDVENFQARTTLNYFFHAVHSINLLDIEHFQNKPTYKVPVFHQSIKSIHFYEKFIIIIKK